MTPALSPGNLSDSGKQGLRNDKVVVGRSSKFTPPNSPMVFTAETIAPLPSPAIATTQHHTRHHRPTTLRSTTTVSPPRWWRRHRRPTPPPLLQRPIPPTPPPPPLPSLDPSTHDTFNRDLATAADVLSLMDSLHLPVDTDFYVTLIRECTDARDAVQGAAVHAHIQRHRPTLLRRPAGRLLANRLLLMYAASGHTDGARLVFDEMSIRDAISWATLIAAFSDGGCHRDAIQLFVDGWSIGKPDGCCFATAVTTVLRSCLRMRELDFALQLHGLVLKTAENSGDGWQLGSPLVQLYTALGHYRSARKVFDRMRHRGTAAWACVITACCRDDGFEEAFYSFREMGRVGARKNCYTFSSIFPACAGMGDDGWGGRQVHGCAIKVGVDFDRFVGSSLVGMYAKCGFLEDARRAFEVTVCSSGVRDAVCWNAMLSGYAQRGCCREAIRFLYEMKAAGIEPEESVLDQVRTACVG